MSDRGDRRQCEDCGKSLKPSEQFVAEDVGSGDRVCVCRACGEAGDAAYRKMLVEGEAAKRRLRGPSTPTESET